MQELTVIFFSCRRLDLLHKSIKAFSQLYGSLVGVPIIKKTNQMNEILINGIIRRLSDKALEYLNLSNQIKKIQFRDKLIIVNDSGDRNIWEQLEKTYQGATFVFNKENVGIIQSIDNGYLHIKTEYFFHCEDDWCVTKDGFIEQSLEIMEARPDIEEVWLADYNNSPLEPEVLKIGNTSYQLLIENYQKGLNGYNDFAWHGFTTACGLKRLSDYKKVAPYADVPWEGTIWHREQAIGEKYHDLGYRSACLIGEYAVNIGYGRSEYVTGNEK